MIQDFIRSATLPIQSIIIRSESVMHQFSHTQRCRDCINQTHLGRLDIWSSAHKEKFHTEKANTLASMQMVFNKNGKPHKMRLYSIASGAFGDFGDSKQYLDMSLNQCHDGLCYMIITF